MLKNKSDSNLQLNQTSGIRSYSSNLNPPLRMQERPMVQSGYITSVQPPASIQCFTQDSSMHISTPRIPNPGMCGPAANIYSTRPLGRHVTFVRTTPQPTNPPFWYLSHPPCACTLPIPSWLPRNDGLALRPSCQYPPNHSGMQSLGGPVRNPEQIFTSSPPIQARDPRTEPNHSELCRRDHSQCEHCRLSRTKDYNGENMDEWDLIARDISLVLEETRPQNPATPVTVSPSPSISQWSGSSLKEDEGNPELARLLNIPEDESVFYEWWKFPPDSSLPHGESDAQSGSNLGSEDPTNLIEGSKQQDDIPLEVNISSAASVFKNICSCEDICRCFNHIN